MKHNQWYIDTYPVILKNQTEEGRDCVWEDVGLNYRQRLLLRRHTEMVFVLTFKVKQMHNDICHTRVVSSAIIRPRSATNSCWRKFTRQLSLGKKEITYSYMTDSYVMSQAGIVCLREISAKNSPSLKATLFAYILGVNTKHDHPTENYYR